MTNPFPFAGLSDKEVIASRSSHGSNVSKGKEKGAFVIVLRDIATDPMFILLIAISLIYFVIGKIAEGTFMLVAVLLEVTISIYQDARSRRALAALKEYTQVATRVIRNNVLVEIPSEEIVIGDHVVVEEGHLIPADGEIICAHDFSINESVLTGESQAVIKNESDASIRKVFQGTLAVSGSAVFIVTEIGRATQFGQIEHSLEDIKEEKTPLQSQIKTFVRNMAIGGSVAFFVILIVNWYHTGLILESLPLTYPESH